MEKSPQGYDYDKIISEAERLAKSSNPLGEIGALKDNGLKSNLLYLAAGLINDPKMRVRMHLESYRLTPDEKVFGGEAHNWAGTAVKASLRGAITQEEAQGELKMLLKKFPQWRRDISEGATEVCGDDKPKQDEWSAWLKSQEKVEEPGL